MRSTYSIAHKDDWYAKLNDTVSVQSNKDRKVFARYIGAVRRVTYEKGKRTVKNYHFVISYDSSLDHGDGWYKGNDAGDIIKQMMSCLKYTSAHFNDPSFRFFSFTEDSNTVEFNGRPVSYYKNRIFSLTELLKQLNEKEG